MMTTKVELTRGEWAEWAIGVAEMHQDKGAMSSSAKLCIKDAWACMARAWELTETTGAIEYYGFAISRALKSLAYSVGMFHKDYQSVKALEVK